MINFNIEQPVLYRGVETNQLKQNHIYHGKLIESNHGGYIFETSFDYTENKESSAFIIFSSATMVERYLTTEGIK